MLSMTAQYAMRIMVVLADADGAPLTSERLAAESGVPADYSVKVLQMLARGGLVRAQRGRGGGFHLACDAATTSLLDVLRAIDTLERIVACPLGRTPSMEPPHDPPLCALHRAIDGVYARLEESLRAFTLRRLTSHSWDEGEPLCPAPPLPPPLALPLAFPPAPPAAPSNPAPPARPWPDREIE